MNKHRFFILVLLALFALGLTACEKSASKPPDSLQEEAGFPLPEADVTQDPMEILTQAGTQTAIAESAGAQQPEAGGDQPAESGEGSGKETAGEVSETGGEEAAAPGTGATEEKDAEAGGGQAPVTVPEEFEVPDTYVLQPGEFPYCIARRFDIDPGTLLSVNNLSRSAVVYPGTRLTIPQNAPPFTAGARALIPHPTTYTVRAGDTIYTIACAFGDVDPRAIAAANGLSGDFSLTVGQVLSIP